MRLHAPRAAATGKRDVGCDAPTNDYTLKFAKRKPSCSGRFLLCGKYSELFKRFEKSRRFLVLFLQIRR